MGDREITKKVKDAFDLVDFVSQSVQLKRSGKHYVGLSPFKKEKSPSFTVNPDKQNFFCYSSNQGGDIFDFVMLTQGYSFPEALDFLAKKAGIQLERSNLSPQQLAKQKEAEEERKVLLKLNQFAAKFYQNQLEGAAGGPARDYVKKRGILPEYQLNFALGYAPDSWTALRDYFIQLKAPLLKAYALGLFRTKGGEAPKEDGSNLFDTFRNRLIFPIRDLQGEVLGFGGRWLGANSAETPKYINSLESPLYEKEKVLYNLDQARKSIRDMGSVVLVEGYMDCLSLVQAGFPNVVANCGTALTKIQAHTLRKMAPKIICLYDSDEAGKAAAERAMDIFLENEGVPLLCALLEGDAKDPDEFLKQNGEAGRVKMAEILQNSPALLDLWMEKLVKATPSTLQARTESLDKAAKKLARLKEDLWIRTRIPTLARGLSLEESLVADAIRSYRGTQSGSSTTQMMGSGSGAHAPRASAPNNAISTARSGPKPSESGRNLEQKTAGNLKQNSNLGGKTDFGFERRFLGDLLQHPSWIALLRERHANDAATVLPYLQSTTWRSLLEKFLQPLEKGEFDQSRIEKEMEDSRDNPELRNFFHEVLVRDDGKLPDSDLDAALKRLKDDFLKTKTLEVQKKISVAQQEGNSELVQTLFQELMSLELTRKTAKN